MIVYFLRIHIAQTLHVLRNKMFHLTRIGKEQMGAASWLSQGKGEIAAPVSI